MNIPSRTVAFRWALPPLGALALTVVVAWSPTGDALAQAPKAADHTKHVASKPGGADQPLADQIKHLRAKVAELEAALEQRHQGRAGAAAPTGDRTRGPGMMGRGMTGGGMGTGRGGSGMGTMGTGMGMGGGQGMGMMGRGQGMGGGMGMMEGMDMGMMGEGGMGGRGMGMMGDMDMMGGGQGMGQGGMGMMEGTGMGMMGMGAMGQARGMAGMTLGSALPGFPGASHLYHVGSTGFFLDHDEHITLSAEQKASLNRIKEQALLAGASAKRQVDEAEQELWALTAADEPDVKAIEAKAKAIEAARSNQRLAFIRAVGEAAKVLTPEQRQQLVGAAAGGPGPTSTAPMP